MYDKLKIGVRDLAFILALIIFSMIVLVHEFGHFIVAKKNGIAVEEFAVGMGPKILSKKVGETVYSIRILPLGGFCQMLGEDSESDSEKAFGNKSVLQRILVVIAGASMNFILALLIFICLIGCNGVEIPKVRKVLPDSPAYKSGILAGDYIYKINNNRVHVIQDLNFYLSDLKDKKELDLVVKRRNKLLDFRIKLSDEENKNYILGFEKDYLTGFMTNINGYKHVNIFDMFFNAIFMILFYIKLTFVGLFRLICLKLRLKDMAGPVGIVKIIGDVYNNSAKQAIFYRISELANFTAVLSANIGIFNLLPWPALDGGRLFFLLLEALRHKKISQERESLVHFIGFVVLIIFAVIITISDILKII